MIRKTLLGISLALLVGTVALWVMSYWITLGVSLGTHTAHYYGSVGYGFVRCVRWHDSMTAPDRPPISAKWIGGAVPVRNLWHFQWFRNSRKRMVDCPAWLPPALLTTWSWFLVRPFMRKRKRRRYNLCLHCGYNLTGNTSGVCPECGKRI